MHTFVLIVRYTLEKEFEHFYSVILLAKYEQYCKEYIKKIICREEKIKESAYIYYLNNRKS